MAEAVREAIISTAECEFSRRQLHVEVKPTTLAFELGGTTPIPYLFLSRSRPGLTQSRFIPDLD